MSKFKSVLIMLFLIFIGFKILTESQTILYSVSFALSIFKENVFPSLFPFLILSNLLINYGFVEFMATVFQNFMGRFFKINKYCAFIFFMSIISGNPTNAKYTKELYDDGKINKYEAIKILSFSSFTSPLFILGTVSLLLNSKKYALIILLCHYLSNIILGIFLRCYHPSSYKFEKVSFKKAICNMHNKRISNKDSFGVIITNSLINSINTLLLILGVITVCLILTTILDNSINVSGFSQSILNGLIEMTQGLKYISKENISLELKCMIMLLMISFGGFSVHLQIMSILSDIDIKYFPFFIFRILASLIAVLCFILIR